MKKLFRFGSVQNKLPTTPGITAVGELTNCLPGTEDKLVTKRQS
jgi:hypothetical protein